MKARRHLEFYLNGTRHTLTGSDCFLPLSRWLRERQNAVATKVVCSEGDCGACSVLVAFAPPKNQADGSSEFRLINSCIYPMILLDATSIVTTEGLALQKGSRTELSEVQKKIAECNGTQCGFCTPGFAVAVTHLIEKKPTPLDANSIKNALTGNLCRCTGYEPIIEAAQSVDITQHQKLTKRYLTPQIRKAMNQLAKETIEVGDEQRTFCEPTRLADATHFFQQSRETKIIAGATDLGVLVNKEKLEYRRHLSLNRIPKSHQILLSKNQIEVGAAVTLQNLEDFLEDHVTEFAELLHIFASPQIKSVATLVGNVANGSPIGDTLPPLLCLDAEVKIRKGTQSRIQPLTRFFKGYRKLDLKPGEWIESILIQKPDKNDAIRFLKASQRRDLDISSVSAALKFSNKKTKSARIALGGVAATPIRLLKTEKLLIELVTKPRSSASENLLLESAQREINPISDLRASAEYRRKVISNWLRSFYREISP
jgi:xanthine dehydrogenase small subunit